MLNQAIITPYLPDPAASFHPHARRVGDFIYISGLIARLAGKDKIPGVEINSEGKVDSYDIEAQTRAIFKNLKYILEAANSSMDKVIDVTVFLTNIEKDFKIFNKIYGEYLGEVNPCRTTVEVSRFPSPVNIEMKIIAIA